MSHTRGILTLWVREIIRYFRDKTRVVSSFVQPASVVINFWISDPNPIYHSWIKSTRILFSRV